MPTYYIYGGVAEWSKAAVLKTVEGLRPPWVRIPPPPLVQKSTFGVHFLLSGGEEANCFASVFII